MTLPSTTYISVMCAVVVHVTHWPHIHFVITCIFILGLSRYITNFKMSKDIICIDQQPCSFTSPVNALHIIFYFVENGGEEIEDPGANGIQGNGVVGGNYTVRWHLNAVIFSNILTIETPSVGMGCLLWVQRLKYGLLLRFLDCNTMCYNGTWLHTR